MSGVACPTYRSGFYSPKRGGIAAFPDMWRGCVGAWAPLLGQTYDRILDQAGYGNHAGITGTYSASADWSRQDGQSVFRTYNTGPSYVSIPFANASAFTNAGSFILWLSRWGTTTGNDGAWVISSNGSSNHYPYSGTIYDGTFCTARQTVGSSLVDITSGVIPLHSVAITFGGGVYTFYQNGRPIYTASGLTFDPPESTLRIGHNGGDYKSMAVHEARLYNVCLTPAQVRRFTLRPGQAYEIDYRRRSRMAVAAGGVVPWLYAVQGSRIIGGGV